MMYLPSKMSMNMINPTPIKTVCISCFFSSVLMLFAAQTAFAVNDPQTLSQLQSMGGTQQNVTNTSLEQGSYNKSGRSGMLLPGRPAQKSYYPVQK